MEAALARLVDRIRAAAAAREPLRIRGGDTKAFYGNAVHGATLDTREFTGIVAHEPSELYVTARAGTPLAEIEAALAAHGQCFAFEPPHFAAGATIGGCVAAGLSGPRRAGAGPVAGAVRDHVLGARLVDGRGRVLAFGGTVIKNVAGFDVARALAGSLGVLGLVSEVTLKVLPRPPHECSLALACDAGAALALCHAWRGRPLPVSATAWCDGMLVVRLSGAEAAVRAAQRELGGEPWDGAPYWPALRDHRLPFFGTDAADGAGAAESTDAAVGEGAGVSALWRVAVPATADPLALGGRELIEWGGALRWLRTDVAAADVRARAAALGGHATLFRGGPRSAGAFTPLAPALATLHRRLKAEFDPAGIFNCGRLYPEL